MSDRRVIKWRRWCDEHIRPDVYSMHLHRHVFQEISAITNAQELPSSYFFEYLGETYATAQMIAVRRQADLHPQSASLGKLLSEIADDPERISRKFYVEAWGEDDARQASAAFDSFAGKGDEHIDPLLVRRDLKSLSDTAESVTRYVNEYIAHSDARPKAAVPTFEELNVAIDSLGRLYDRYNNVLTGGSSHGSLTPVIIDHDWKAVFRVPWIEPPGGRILSTPDLDPE
jgi:hypothetical protein